MKKKLMKKKKITPATKKFRLNMVYAISFLALSGLVVRAAYVQVVNGSKFSKQETKIQFVNVPALPQRGWIYDANGKVLAWDKPADEIVVDNFAGTSKKQDHQIANELGPVLKVAPSALYKKMRGDKNSLQIPLTTQATQSQIAFVAEHQSQLPGVEIHQAYSRQYPQGDLAGQVLGYVSSITAQNASYYHDQKGYLYSQKVGASGLEQQYESILQGKAGVKLLNVNPSTNSVQTVGYSPAPVSGNNIQVTLDGHMQAEAQMILKHMIDKSPNHKIITDASAVMLNVKTGGVISMVSYPYLNPNWYTAGKQLNAQQVQYLKTSGAQENYAIQAPEYPGSTVKPANFITDMNNGVLTPNTKIDDQGFIRIGTGIIHEDAGIAFGWVNPIRAIAVSSDVFFYEMGLHLGKWFGSSTTNGGTYPPKDGSYQHYLNTDFIKGVNHLFQGEWNLGLGPKTGIDLPNESAGRFYIENRGHAVPFNLQKSEASVKKTGQYVNHGTPEDLAFGSIGQSQQFTTLQLATYAMNLANMGKKLKPHVLQKVYSADGTPDTGATPTKVVKPVVEGQVKAKPNAFQMVKTAMNDVTTGKVGGYYATAYGIFTSAPYKVAAKTGTAQISINHHKTLNSVFIAYAPLKNPQVAVAIMIPGGGYGASLSGPISRQMFDAYFNEHHASFMPKKGWTNTDIPKNWPTSSANTLVSTKKH